MSKIIGHRGAKGLATENTLISIVKALECDADEVEVDVRVTGDGVPVLHHDRAVAVKGKSLSIAKHSLRELREVWPDLATLEEGIRSVDRAVPLMIEVKPRVPIEPITATLRGFLRQEWQPRDFLLASKSQRTLRALHKALPKIEIVVIERWSGVRGGWRARQLSTKRLSMNHHFLWFGFIRAMSRRGYHLTAYTLNDTHKAERWAKHGLYAIITDYPDRFTHNKAPAIPTRTEKVKASRPS